MFLRARRSIGKSIVFRKSFLGRYAKILVEANRCRVGRSKVRE
jgi:hypothetical protein